MSGCQHVQTQFAEFVADELSAETAASVRAHLVECVVCRREASRWQQARGALRSLAQPVVGVDEAMFTAMHRSIVASVQEPAPAGARPTVWLSAAAVLLMACGIVLGMTLRSGRSVWNRQPTATPAASSMVVPWSGPRPEMRLLGDEQVGQDPWRGGLWDTHRLRALVDEGVPVPMTGR